MMSFLVVTITCFDRPGIIERVTDVVVTHGGNWEDGLVRPSLSDDDTIG